MVSSEFPPFPRTASSPAPRTHQVVPADVSDDIAAGTGEDDVSPHAAGDTVPADRPLTVAFLPKHRWRALVGARPGRLTVVGKRALAEATFEPCGSEDASDGELATEC
jgi:hypothetical protein